VRKAEERLERQVGRPVPVLVTARDLRAGTSIGPRTARRILALRSVPERFAPPDSLASASEAVGFRTAVDLVAGAYVTASALRPREDAAPATDGLAERERLMEVAVAGGESLALASGPGARPLKVDVLVTKEGSTGAGRTYVALRGADLVALRAATEAEGEREAEARPGRSLATLRLTLDQAVALTAAQNFAREIRLLARPGAR